MLPFGLGTSYYLGFSSFGGVVVGSGGDFIPDKFQKPVRNKYRELKTPIQVFELGFIFLVYAVGGVGFALPPP